jgi:hypothetical protein
MEYWTGNLKWSSSSMEARFKKKSKKVFKTFKKFRTKMVI